MSEGLETFASICIVVMIAGIIMYTAALNMAFWVMFQKIMG